MLKQFVTILSMSETNEINVFDADNNITAKYAKPLPQLPHLKNGQTSTVDHCA